MTDTVSIPANRARNYAATLREMNAMRPNAVLLGVADLLDPKPPTLREKLEAAQERWNSTFAPEPLIDVLLAVIVKEWRAFADEHCFSQGDHYAIATHKVGEWLRGAR